ncbi:hypothetical protein [Mycobacterium sp. ZZG]
MTSASNMSPVLNADRIDATAEHIATDCDGLSRKLFRPGHGFRGLVVDRRPPWLEQSCGPPNLLRGLSK